MKIKLLSPEVADQIAAGEVVERPASVVKELVENSLDSGATEIDIYIENGGIDLIRILDNGCGMSPEDAEKCTLRHATSKVRVIDDLFSVHTFGFRGEALAAISAVSKFQLITKTEKEDVATQICISAGVFESKEFSAGNLGTDIIIKDLFYPTPARLAYLKTPETEYREILKQVKAFALSSPKASFKLYKSDKLVLDLPMVENLGGRVSRVLGKNEASFIALESAFPQLRIKGFIGRPESCIGSRNQQYLFVNGRKIEDGKLAYAIREGYNQSCGIEKHLYPLFVLFLETDPLLVDVNVHPRKLEVKFSEPSEVFGALKSICFEALSKASMTPETESFHSPSPFFKTNTHSTPSNSFSATKSVGLSNLNASLGLSFGARNKAREVGQNNFSFLDLPQTSGSLCEAEQVLGELTLIGQVGRKYILAENETGLFVFDQHALHERQRFEKYWKEYFGKKIPQQKCLIPEIIELDSCSVAEIFEAASILNELGFKIQLIDDTHFEILSIPVLLVESNLTDFFHHFVEYIENDKIGEHGIEKCLRELVEYKSCRGAVMYGDTLSLVDMQTILSDLSGTQFKWLCAHGRPNYIFWSFAELDKKFHR